jgi:hypothetical protein
MPRDAHTIEAQVSDVVYMGDILRARLKVAGQDDFVMKYPQYAGAGETVARPNDPHRLASRGCPRARSGLTRVCFLPRRSYDETHAYPDIGPGRVAFGAQAQDKQVDLLSWGGAYGNSHVEAYAKPFEAKTGIKVSVSDADNPATPIKAQVEAGNVTTDVASVEYADAVRLCDEGLLEEIDASILLPPPMAPPPPMTSSPAR